MSDFNPNASRRALLQALTAMPVAVSVGTAIGGGALATLHMAQHDEPALLCRTREGRILSRARYHRAESFFGTLRAGILTSNNEVLYYSGIVAQLALNSHLLDIGFADEWCAHFIGLRVAKALDHANASGLGHDCPDMARLAMVLTPYWKWRQPRWDEPLPADGSFTVDQELPLLRALLNRVHEVTGHPRPSGWRRRFGGK